MQAMFSMLFVQDGIGPGSNLLTAVEALYPGYVSLTITSLR
jgi:hypothetical protein